MVGAVDGPDDSCGGDAHRLGSRVRAVFHRARIRTGDSGLAANAARVRRGGCAGVEAADAPAAGQSHGRAAAVDWTRLADDLRDRRIFLPAARIQAIAPDQARGRTLRG